MKITAPLLICFSLYAYPTFAHTPEYQLEQVVSLTRHGVRPQTDTAELNAVTGKQWVTWQVPDGHLTEHGYIGIQQQAKYQYAQWIQAGLPMVDCPTEKNTLIWASPAQRTQKTADAISKGMFPQCNTPVQSTKYEKDPLFNTMKMEKTLPSDFSIMQQEFNQKIGSTAKLNHHYKQNILLLKNTVCAPQSCQFLDQPWQLKADKNGQPKLKGPVENGANIGETIRLQYSENLPLSEVAFGHVKNAKDVKQYMMLHEAKYHYVNEISLLAQQGGSILMQEMLKALEGSRPLTLFVGHDTNIAQIQTMLKFNWQLPQYPHNDIPPGGTLAFEKYKQLKTGKEFVKITFSARTLDQWRNLTPLSQQMPLATATLKYNYCKKTKVGILCPLDTFIKNTQKTIIPTNIKQPLFE